MAKNKTILEGNLKLMSRHANRHAIYGIQKACLKLMNDFLVPELAIYSGFCKNLLTHGMIHQYQGVLRGGGGGGGERRKGRILTHCNALWVPV